MDKKTFDKGVEVRTAVLGKQYVENALKNVDEFIGGVLDTFDTAEMLLVLFSDHGNLEDMSTKSHTRNPVPLVAFGREHSRLTARVRKLTDIVPALLDGMK